MNCEAGLVTFFKLEQVDLQVMAVVRFWLSLLHQKLLVVQAAATAHLVNDVLLELAWAQGFITF